MKNASITTSNEPLFEEGFVTVNGINLHYVDWGGNSKPLILVHAWGDSPYLFNGLAQQLNSTYRIITYSGRGHCKSDAPRSGYAISNLAEDLKQLLDKLKIKNTSLLGFSSAGSEITEFAINHPERTDKIIYLEGGYDLSSPFAKAALKNLPSGNLYDPTVRTSIEKYRNWFHNFWYAGEEWTELLENNLLATTKINADGTVEPIPDDALTDVILESHFSYNRAYTKIKAPVLALFAPTFLNAPATDSTLIKEYENWQNTYVDAWKQHSINKLRHEIKNIIIKEIPGTTHTTIIFKNTNYLLNLINAFLNN